ncbi:MULTISPECIES: glycosyltransferase family 2 protein [unclassified Oceanobacter]|uniref:glycosyltransferase family 2 protein n=1 Tax=unclassified Oceanobacter TaxID=2620260 RepID=UPI002732841A|nr:MULTISPECIES: glycosyltransferase family 2 protein [unclassified Oceanobacter]MDP2609901.1 glycosyltransferase family 2 protein [Oceanobacter sp. 1_MG-2023]MDP2613217.1 glycosyltransferase family 2 protein [Oceanobacter sp. 2_MG-2023]
MLKLSMNLLIKNEVDIIEDNIRFHSNQGVDCFVVMDNGSTDGTREVVAELSKKHEILVIDRPELDYQQSNWKTEMAAKSRRILGADWSIANDADEFWLSDSGDLKSNLGKWGSIVKCSRSNMIPDDTFFSGDSDYLDFPYRVKSPILNKGQDIINNDSFSVFMGNINGKVMVNNHGLLRVKGGNHRAWHLWGFINQTIDPSITVYHYPIRSRECFVKSIENRARLLNSGVTKMGDHYRRWVRMLDHGLLDEELERLALKKETATVLENFGIIEKEPEVGRKIREVMNSRN